MDRLDRVAALTTLDLPTNIITILNGNALGHVINFIHADEARRELEHVVAERNDDELGVFGAFFDVTCHDGDLLDCQLVYIVRTIVEAVTRHQRVCDVFLRWSCRVETTGKDGITREKDDVNNGGKHDERKETRESNQTERKGKSKSKSQ
ncbi:hypothetical protein L228DRAFT_162366 [Xylona heveae TC161]|uniref:Uncharacterized protein n=1 Tax=Xylona heveae (strain CBS 132557 / TC161) TaxID=1328760 RepID=A0A165G924_XYLHT|nr:hypothetical protein L228DRAFT_162366 [Xylona heveae TC161]KZF21894.1 hypothetical protein L228DRAFT_162366 [Xylona heveae TC161]